MNDREPCRVLVAGAGGQLGKELLAAPWPGGTRVAGMTRRELDIVDARAVKHAVDGGSFDIVVNAAAYTAVDRAESERDLAFAVNAAGAGNLAAACARRGATLIHVSTDYVFDGAKASPYLETDPVAPLGAYGGSKLAGENLIRGSLARHLILRTAWVYGAHGHNFVKTMIGLAKERDELRVVSDQTGNPTSAADLAAGIAGVVAGIVDGKTDCWGTYHLTNAGETTWCGLAEAVVDLAAGHLGRRPRVVPIRTEDYPTPAARPANSRLDCSKIQAAFGVSLKPWRRALEDVVGTIFRAEEEMAGATAP